MLINSCAISIVRCSQSFGSNPGLDETVSVPTTKLMSGHSKNSSSCLRRPVIKYVLKMRNWNGEQAAKNLSSCSLW